MDKRLAASAAAQSGAFNLVQADVAKTKRSLIRSRVDSGMLRREHGKILVVAGTPKTRELTLWTALLAVGQPAAIAGRDAARRFGLPVEIQDGSDVCVAVAQDRSVRPRDGIRVQRLARWDPSQLIEIEGLSFLGVRDTILGLAAEMSPAKLHAVVQDATYRYLVTLAELAAGRRRGLAGSGLLGQILQAQAAGFDSAGEVRAHGLLATSGFRPQPNVLLIAADGTRAGPADGYLDIGVAYELDGRRAHDNARARARDARKDADYTRLNVDVRRFSPEVLDGNGIAFVAEMREAVRQRLLRPPPNVRIIPARRGLGRDL